MSQGSVPQSDGDDGRLTRAELDAVVDRAREATAANEREREVVVALVTIIARVKDRVHGPTHQALEAVLGKAWQQYQVKDHGWDLDVTVWRRQEAARA